MAFCCKTVSSFKWLFKEILQQRIELGSWKVLSDLGAYNQTEARWWRKGMHTLSAVAEIIGTDVTAGEQKQILNFFLYTDPFLLPQKESLMKPQEQPSLPTGQMPWGYEPLSLLLTGTPGPSGISRVHSWLSFLLAIYLLLLFLSILKRKTYLPLISTKNLHFCSTTRKWASCFACRVQTIGKIVLQWWG